MPGVRIRAQGIRQIRQRIASYQSDLSGGRASPSSRSDWRRRVRGDAHQAGIEHTPNPRGPERPGWESRAKNRTGNLLSTFNVGFVNQNVLQFRWSADYASYVNASGFSAGYVQRTIQDFRKRLRRFAREEARKRARREASRGAR